jgi:hypothetical protein
MFTHALPLFPVMQIHLIVLKIYISLQIVTIYNLVYMPLLLQLYVFRVMQYCFCLVALKQLNPKWKHT